MIVFVVVILRNLLLSRLIEGIFKGTNYHCCLMKDYIVGQGNLEDMVTDLRTYSVVMASHPSKYIAHVEREMRREIMSTYGLSIDDFAHNMDVYEKS